MSEPSVSVITEQDATDAFVDGVLDAMSRGGEPRVAKVTGIEGTGDFRVHLDLTGDTYWAPSLDSTLAVGDRVWVVKSGSTFVVQGRLNGAGGGVPVGTIAQFVTGATPQGWVTTGGQAISRTVYKRLFALIGTTYGAGDGATTFNVPSYSLGTFTTMIKAA